MEIIVVDMGDCNVTRDVLSRFQAHGVLMRVVPIARKGLNYARNVGIKNAQGDIIAFIDHDEIIPPGIMGTLVSNLISHPEAVAVGGWYRGRVEGIPPRHFWCGREILGEGAPGSLETDRVQEVNDLPGGVVVVWRDAFRRYGLFDERIAGPGDDRVWFRKVSRQGGKLLFDPKAWVWHRKSADMYNILKLVRSAIWYGSGMGKADAIVGECVPFSSCLRQALGFLKHALFCRCRFGLSSFLGTIAYIVAYIFWKIKLNL